MLMHTDQTYGVVSFTSGNSQLKLPLKIEFPDGLIGSPDLCSATLRTIEGEEPFMWLTFDDPETPINFIVIEPNGLVPNYSVELFDQDAKQLEVTGANDAFMLNIVTMRETIPATASVNLAGPIIVNCHTLRAKQVVISNYMSYRTPYILGGS